uniref:Protein kinase domain-containing protein n=2 Tax=Acrobeloides nanus TaxID=290746 RepID=A0A914ER86_9BILA
MEFIKKILYDVEVGDYIYNQSDSNKLGEGGFGQVYRGMHKKDKELKIAVKIISKKVNLEQGKCFDKEIEINKKRIKLDEEAICHFFKQIGEGLNALNKLGILHRDIKPQNILLCNTGSIPLEPRCFTIKLANFGLSRFTDINSTLSVCGYIAPEVYTQNYDIKSDLWSVGIIMFECVAGDKPNLLANTMITEITDCSDGLKDLISRLIKLDINERMNLLEFRTHQFFRQQNLIRGKNLRGKIVKLNNQCSYKIMLIGQDFAGANSIFIRIHSDEFTRRQGFLIGANYVGYQIQINNKDVNLQLWVTTPIHQQSSEEVSFRYCRGADAIIFIYDITDNDSFNKIKSWLPRLKNEYKLNDALFAMAGNKMDLSDERVVLYEDALEYAIENNFIFMEMSAKTSENVNELLYTVTEQLLYKHAYKK